MTKEISRREFFEGLSIGAAALAGLGRTRGASGLWRPLAVSRELVSLAPAQNESTAGAMESLKSVAAAKGLLFGCAFRSDWLLKDPEILDLVRRECSVVVPEYEMKWNVVEPQPGRFAFSRPDRIAAFAAASSIALRGHTLVWHDSLPPWAQIAARDAAESTLKRHISTAVSHFAGGIDTWDVVNEPINVPDGAPGGLRRTVWWQALGPRYIPFALRTAAAADPRARLAINENSLEYDDAYGRAKRAAVLGLLESLRRSGEPLHTLGIQGHLRGNRSPREFQGLRAFIKDVADLGLAIQITELDVADARLPVETAARDASVADQYGEFLALVLDEPAVEAVLTWGVTDRGSWLASYAPRTDKAPVRPLLWDSELNPKPAYQAALKAIGSAPVRSRR